jgi:hypothetical protein
VALRAGKRSGQSAAAKAQATQAQRPKRKRPKQSVSGEKQKQNTKAKKQNKRFFGLRVFWHICTMGLEQSRPTEEALVKTTNGIIELYEKKTDELWLHNTIMLQYISVLENKASLAQGTFEPATGWVFLSKRGDGSSVKELLIPDWDAVFFMTNGKLDIRLNKGELVPSGDGQVLLRDSADRLFFAFTKWKDAECAKFAAIKSFNEFMGEADKI